MIDRLSKFKASNYSAAFTAVAQICVFFSLIFVYLAFDNSQKVAIFGVLIGFPFFLFTSFFFVFGVPFNIFQKATYIRLLYWFISGGILLNIIGFLAK